MKTIYKKNGLLLIGACCMLLINACTKQFKAFNTNPSQVTAAQSAGDYLYIAGFLPDMEQNVSSPVDWEYQTQQNLNADIFSGYMSSPDDTFGPNNATYYMRYDWNNEAFDLGNQHIMNDWLKIEQLARPQDAHFVAIALILKVEGMHRVTDIYGPIPYSKYGSSSFFIPYDAQQDIYTRFFSELDTAVTTLTAFVKANPGATPLKPYDYFFGGDYTQWIKFANTLRLRLAMRIVYANAALAQQQAEKAVADPGGLLSDPVKDRVLLGMVNGLSYQNSLWNITNAYSDISMGAPMQSILEGYHDPREGVYFLKSADNPAAFEAIRSGISITTSIYAKFSLLNVQPTTPMQIMSASESYFLRAEGALRGWNMGQGTAQSFYEAGITNSFTEQGAAMPAGYLTDATSTAAPYVDPKNAANNVPAGNPYLNDVTIKWDATASEEVNLQRIITQKWLAIYPDGEEAWAEFRRTGYPKQFPVIENDSQGTILTTEYVQRLPYTTNENSTNPKGVASGVAALGGPDNGGTKLWWNKKP
jgi:hypothetical protein